MKAIFYYASPSSGLLVFPETLLGFPAIPSEITLKWEKETRVAGYSHGFVLLKPPLPSDGEFVEVSWNTGD